MSKQLFFILLMIAQFSIKNINAQDAAATGISRAFNPAISVNALFSGMASSEQIPLWEDYGTLPGLHCQALDIEITSNVDVYLQSKVVLGGSESEAIEVEEAYLTTLRMPIPVIIRGGKMLNTFGRYNLYHIHHMAFDDYPLILHLVFGPKLNEVGVEASYLMPFSWYSDLLVGVLNGNNEYLFDSDKQEHLAYQFHFDNLWELSEEITLRLGSSFLSGSKGLRYQTDFPFDSTISEITSSTWGIDFHIKWKPLQYGRYHSFIIEGEYVNSTLNIDGSRTQPLHGYFVQGLYKMGLEWWIQARYDWFNRSKELHNYFQNPDGLEINSEKDFNGSRISLALAYVPTEFSAFRLQYNYQELAGKDEQQIVLQVNVTIGSHPAHKY